MMLLFLTAYEGSTIEAEFAALYACALLSAL